MSWDRLWKLLCILASGGMVLQVGGCGTDLVGIAAQLVMSLLLGGLGT